MTDYAYNNARLGKLRHENSKFKDNLGYTTRSCLKKTKIQIKHPKHKKPVSVTTLPPVMIKLFGELSQLPFYTLLTLTFYY